MRACRRLLDDRMACASLRKPTLEPRLVGLFWLLRLLGHQVWPDALLLLDLSKMVDSIVQ